MPFVFSEPYGLPSVALGFFVAYVGLIVGSFITVVATRAPGQIDGSPPQREGLWGRSHCRHCDAVIPWYRNIPVLAWLLQRGRAACCGRPIALIYPIVEVAALVLTVWPAMILPSSMAIPTIVAGWTALTLCAICWLRKKPTPAVVAAVVSAPLVLALLDYHLNIPINKFRGFYGA